MITSITIEDFKSYRQAEFIFSPLTVLIGANASGKSNALEALRFLSWLAQGQKLSSLLYKVGQEDQLLRGNVEQWIRNDESSFSLTSKFEDDLELHSMFYIRSDEELHIVHETLYQGHEMLYSTKKPQFEGINTDIEIEYNNFARGGKKPMITCNDQQAIFLQLVNASRFAEGHVKTQKTLPQACKKIEEALLNILFLDPLPNKMRGYSFISEKELVGDGRNVSSVLYHLWKEEKTGNREKILAFIQSLPEQDITSLDFLIGPRGEVMLQVVETFGKTKKKTDASNLSDGTLRVLAVAAALLSVPEESLVVIEEMDNGVHPSRAKKLLESITDIANNHKLKVVISSHNPALLDALPLSALPNVVFCYRDIKNGSSKLVTLKDVPNYPELMSQGSLGDLLTDGLLDKFVKNQQDEKLKQQQSLEWLKSIS